MPCRSVLEDVQEPLDGWHVVRVGGRNPIPLVVAETCCRKIQHGHEPRFGVGAVVSEGLPDHLRETRTRRPAVDKLTGKRVYQCRVVDMDPELEGRSREVVVKIIADRKPALTPSCR